MPRGQSSGHCALAHLLATHSTTTPKQAKEPIDTPAIYIDKMKITLPTKKGSPNTNPELDFNQLVVIGANGSGKTRFGARIEEGNHLKTHRISAQKSLSFPKLVRPTSIEVAKNEFFVGSSHPQDSVNKALTYKLSSRWGDNLNTHLLNDYEKF
jgi:hypothetical protein